MNKIQVLHYEFVALKAGDDPLPDLPLARRLSGLQLAALTAIGRWRRKCPEEVAALLHELQVPLFAATHFGELEVLLSLQRSLYDRALPVSPTAFQNSLPSAAGGYVAIVEKLTQPQVVFAAGHLSLDKMLHWAYFKLSRGLLPAVVCLSCTERITNDPNHRAEVELIVLGLASKADAWCLESVRHVPNAAAAIADEILWSHDREALGHIAQLRLDRVSGLSLRRLAYSNAKDGIASIWSRNHAILSF